MMKDYKIIMDKNTGRMFMVSIHVDTPFGFYIIRVLNGTSVHDESGRLREKYLILPTYRYEQQT